MLKILLIIFSAFTSAQLIAQTKTIHVFVALCDNEHQGIVPVSKALGNGKDAKNNLYWGAAYGVKTYFKKTSEWILVAELKPADDFILERILFKHASQDIYLLADAYDGEKIKTCVEYFLKSANGQIPITINHQTVALKFGGDADLIAYAGHDGLMDFNVLLKYFPQEKPRDVFILACFSKSYFSPEIKKANANPLLWTTHLMAPEAYVLKSAIDGWILNENGTAIEERAAQAYHKYQKCGITGARNLFTNGF